MKHTYLTNGFRSGCLFMAAALMVACNSEGKNSTLSDETVVPDAVSIERFDKAVPFLALSDNPEADSLRSAFMPVLDFMRKLTGDTVTNSLIRHIAVSRPIEVFGPDVDRRLPDLSGQEDAIGRMKKIWPGIFPDRRFPSRIFGIITPYSQSVVISDTIVMIGLNHYLGTDYEGYDGFDDYKRKLKIPDRISVDVAEALIYISFPYEQTTGATAVSRMAYEGAVAYALKSLLPDLTLPEVMGYSPQQMEWVENNEYAVWQAMIERNLIFSIDPAVADKLTSPAPYTSLIARESPGRLGRYIGYRIVESYMKTHNDVAVGTLLSPDFYMKTDLIPESGYSGK